MIEKVKKLYMVETVLLTKFRYVVEAYESLHALDEVVMNTNGAFNKDWQEFSQQALDEVISDCREISTTEYLELFDKDNDYLKEWTVDQKLRYINDIDYKD
jgi:hypothetical protein